MGQTFKVFDPTTGQYVEKEIESMTPVPETAAPVAEAVQQAAAPVMQAVQQVPEAVVQAAQPVVQAAQPVVQAVQQAGEKLCENDELRKALEREQQLIDETRHL